MQTSLYPGIPMEGRFVFLSAFNHLFDSLIDAPNSIDHLTRKLDRLDVGRALNIIETKDSNGAKIGIQVRMGIR